MDWSGKYFQQTADITLTGEWLPIGWALNGEVNGKKTAIAAYPFRGSYDGGNFTISGLTIGSESAPADQMASGLFGLTAGEYSTNDQPAGGEQVVRLSNIHLRNIDINVATRYETFTGGLVGSGRSGGITIDSNCYYNASALLKQGNTTLTTVVGIGVAASGAVEDNVVGKTAADLKSDAFAAMLNSNLTKASMKASWDVVDEGLADQNERKYSQVNYYAGTALLPWTVKDGVVTFGENSGENGGTSGGSSGGSAAPSEPETPFTDIPEGSPYESAILWAVKNGITTGTTATTFSPSAPCTRAQAVTFLWRAAGSPELKSDTMPFADVAADSVYAKAILWAVEQGITLGTTESTFSPNAPCARGQIMTFLYRTAN